VATLGDADGSEELRLAAAGALSGIFARSGMVDSEQLGLVREIATSSDSSSVRAATAGALGRLDLSPSMRAELMRAVREE
jgi:HEAT repeat protein